MLRKIIIGCFCCLAAAQLSAQVGLVFGANFVPEKVLFQDFQTESRQVQNFTFVGIGATIKDVTLQVTYTFDLRAVSTTVYVPILWRKKNLPPFTLK